MRKNSPRKWLHAILDLLPVIAIPVFMVFSHRHDVTQRTDVDITYKYQSNEVNTLDDLVEGNIYHLDTLQIDTIGDFGNIVFNVVKLDSITNWNEDGTSVNRSFDEPFYYVNSNNNCLRVIINGLNEEGFLEFTNDNLSLPYDFYNGGFNLNNFDFYLDSDSLVNAKTYFIIKNVIPQYSDYNVIDSVQVNDVESSIMSAFFYDFNNTIDRYFNMGNVFGLNGVYQWFNTNIFNGNAPTIIYSIWNIALYELVMDLLFLLYGLFMWFIDMVQNIMDKPFKSIK